MHKTPPYLNCQSLHLQNQGLAQSVWELWSENLSLFAWHLDMPCLWLRVLCISRIVIVSAAHPARWPVKSPGAGTMSDSSLLCPPGLGPEPLRSCLTEWGSEQLFGWGLAGLWGHMLALPCPQDGRLQVEAGGRWLSGALEGCLWSCYDFSQRKAGLVWQCKTMAYWASVISFSICLLGQLGLLGVRGTVRFLFMSTVPSWGLEQSRLSEWAEEALHCWAFFHPYLKLYSDTPLVIVTQSKVDQCQACYGEIEIKGTQFLARCSWCGLGESDGSTYSYSVQCVP
jgi:hypothetical protein